MNRTNYIWTIVLVILLVILVWFGLRQNASAPMPAQNQEPGTQAYTTPPGWINGTDNATGLTFDYPADFGTKYISVVDWPPKIEVLYEPYSCSEAGEETSRAGRTEKQFIGGREFCVTRESEGAAGSTYTMYAYGFDSGGGATLVLTFSLKFVQCDNYDEPQATECKNERTHFDPGVIISNIASSVKGG